MTGPEGGALPPAERVGRLRTVVGLTVRLLRGGGSRGMLGAALTAGAVAVCAALLLIAVAANHAFGARAERDAWRYPDGVPAAQATMVEALSTQFARGRPITVVELAAEPGERPAAPPGLARFPGVGQVYYSPALARLVRSLPADQLADRFGGGGRHPAGTLGAAGLVHDGELVAVVGRSSTDPAMTTHRFDPYGNPTANPTPIARYAASDPGDGALLYTWLTRLATVLVLVPLLVFGGAAARLTVSRRDTRLASLRLIGATPRQVVAMTAVEAVLTAAAGTVAGAVLYALAVPGLARIPMAGGTWYLSDLWVGVPALLAVLVAVPLLVGLSAVAGLRQVVVGPLGVVRRHTPRGLRFVRVLAFLVLLVAFTAAAQGAGPAVIVGLLAAAFGGLNLVGPWVVGILGRIVGALARRPAPLLAGRRLADDPRAAWRTVSGIALTGFVAGSLAFLSPDPGLLTSSPDNVLTVPTTAGSAPHLAATAADRLRAAGITAKVAVAVPDTPGTPGQRRTVQVTVPDAAGTVDRARTALAGLVPGQPVNSEGDPGALGANILGDIRTGALSVLAASFIIAIASAGITAAAAVLDRRRTYALLRLAGTPLSVLDRARTWETMLPLALMGGGSLVTGLVCASPFAIAGLASPVAVLTLGGFVVLGTAGIVAATALSRPLLRSVTTEPTPQPD